MIVILTFHVALLALLAPRDNSSRYSHFVGGGMPKNRRVLFVPRPGTNVPGRGNVWESHLPVTIQVQQVQEVQVEKCD